MVKKIVCLSVSFVIGFIAIFFSVSASTFTGKGGGTSTKVTSGEKLAEYLDSIPSIGSTSVYDDYYYQLAMASLGENSAGAGQELTSSSVSSGDLIDDTIVPLTIYDTASAVTIKKESSGSDSKTTSYSMTRSMTVCYTQEAAYYSVSGRITSSESEEYGSSSSNNLGYDTYISTTVTDLDTDIYIGIKGIYLRYNKYEILSECGYLLGGFSVADKYDTDDEESEITEMVLGAVQSNCGKWINCLADTDSLSDMSSDSAANMTEDDMVRYMCAMTGAMVALELADVNIGNVAYYSTLSYILSNILSEADYVEKSGNITVANAYGNYYIGEQLGIEMEYPSAGSVSSSSTESTYVSFVLDLSDGTAPAVYFTGTAIASNSGGYSGISYSKSSEIYMNETSIITNIGNTTVPRISSSVSWYDVLGDAYREYSEGQSN